MQSQGDIDNYRYSAPETQFLKDHGKGITPCTFARDVYGMGMIVYEASSNLPDHPPRSTRNLALFQVLTGSIPYSGCDDAVALSKIRAGKQPQRPSEGIPDAVWQFLERCWSMDPRKRPSATQVYNALSKSRSVRPVTEELPERLKLEVQSIKISFPGAKKRRFSVKFKYGNKYHITSPTTRTAAGDEHTWFAVHPSSPSPLSLNIGQEPSGNLVGRNGRKTSQTVGLHPSSLPEIYGYI